MPYRCTSCNRSTVNNSFEPWRNVKLWCSVCEKATQWDILNVLNEAKPKGIGIPNLLESLDKIRELHIRKNQDYASSDNAFSNFEFTEFVLRYFTSDRDKSYVWPIATKLARLATLLSSDREPNNESIEDSFLDIATYILLWKADFARKNKNEKAGS